MPEFRFINMPVVPDHRGNLAFMESDNHVPFAIQRVFYLYDVPSGETRAGHALRDVEQLLFAISGSFDVVIDDGHERRRLPLNRPSVGLYLPPMLWREIENFSMGSVCLVLASAPYDADAYVRDYDDFRAAVAGPGAR